MPSEPFGPFRRDGIDNMERTAQLRCLRALVRTHFPLAELERGLRDCETDYGRLLPTLRLFDAMPPLHRRRILATFAALHSPLYNKECKGNAVQATEGNAHVLDVD
jgi:hypothetical protein